jgi:D-arabinose 1-dehydrogenase-like Zn-dependent alcohol dehydrogenase
VRAATLRAFGERLVVGERERPRWGPGETLLRVRAAGLCGTDLKLVDGVLGPAIRLPVVPGHEVAGEVVGGDGLVPVGARVACHVYAGCGTCAHCVSDRATLCRRAVRIGLERDGGLAEYVAVPTSTLIPIPPGVPDEAAAVAMDSVTAPWAALHTVGAVQAGEHVLVVGAGGLGLNAVQIARGAGACVAVVDIAEGRLEAALGAGAELAVQPERLERVVAWSRDGVDLLVEMSGSSAAFGACLRLVRPAGRVVLCGYSPGTPYPLDSTAVVLGELTILGSRNGSYADARAALDAVARGEVAPTIDRIVPLEETPRALEELRAGRVRGRIVVRP